MVPDAAAVASASQFVSIFERRFSFRFFAIFPVFSALRCVAVYLLSCVSV